MKYNTMNYITVKISDLFEDNLHRTNVAAFFGRVIDFLFQAYAAYSYSPFKILFFTFKNIFAIWAYYLTVAFIDSFFFGPKSRDDVKEPVHDGYCVVESVASAFDVTVERVLSDIKDGHLDVLLDKLFKTHTYTNDSKTMLDDLKNRAAEQRRRYPQPIQPEFEFTILQSVLLCSIIRSIRLNVVRNGLMYTYNIQGTIDLQLIIGPNRAHMRRGGPTGREMRLGELLHMIDPGLPTGARWYQAYTTKILNHFAYKPIDRPSKFIGLDGELIRTPVNKKERNWYRQDFMHYWIHSCHTFDVCHGITLKELKKAFFSLTGETLPTIEIHVPAQRVHGVDHAEKTLVRYKREHRTFPTDKDLYGMLTSRKHEVEMALMYFTRPCYAYLKVLSPEETMHCVHIVAHSRTKWSFEHFQEFKHDLTVGSRIAAIEHDFSTMSSLKSTVDFRNLTWARMYLKHGKKVNAFFAMQPPTEMQLRRMLAGKWDIDSHCQSVYSSVVPDLPGDVAALVDLLQPRPMPIQANEDAEEEEEEPDTVEEEEEELNTESDTTDESEQQEDAVEPSEADPQALRVDASTSPEPTPEEPKEEVIRSRATRIVPTDNAPEDKLPDCRSLNRRAHERREALEENGVLIYVRDAMVTRLAGIPFTNGALNAAFNTFSSHLNLDDGTLNRMRVKTIEAARSQLREIEAGQIREALSNWDLSAVAEKAGAILPAAVRNLLNIFSSFSRVWTGELRQSILDKIGAYGASVAQYVDSKVKKGEESSTRSVPAADRGMPHSSSKPPPNAGVHCATQTALHRPIDDATQGDAPLPAPEVSPVASQMQENASGTTVSGRFSFLRARADEGYTPTPQLDLLRQERPAYAPFWDDKQTVAKEPHSLTCFLKLVARVCYAIITRTKLQRRRGDIRGAASGGLLVLLLVVIN